MRSIRLPALPAELSVQRPLQVFLSRAEATSELWDIVEVAGADWDDSQAFRVTCSLSLGVHSGSFPGSGGVL